MQRCNTCRHWAKPTSKLATTETQGRCKNYSKVGESDDADGLNDHSPSATQITTGPLYGCVHHSYREDRVKKAKASRNTARCTWPTGCNGRATHQHRTSPVMRLCAYHYDTCPDGKPKAQNWEPIQ